MQEADFTAILRVDSLDALRTKLLSTTRKMGFETFTTFAVVDNPGSDPDIFWTDNAPAGFGDSAQYADGRNDPVCQHCKQSTVPLVWDRTTYETAGKTDRWEYQASFGYCAGVAVALHLPHGRHFFIGVDRDQPLPRDSREVMRMAACLQLFAAYAQEAALRLLIPPRQQSEQVPLTARELECLRWTLQGKTAWEVANILGIAEQTAARHLHHAAKKLDCVNKHQAVVRALNRGLIQ